MTRNYNNIEVVVKKQGAPTKYKDSMVEDIHRLARFGCTNEEIAEFFKISEQTFAKYVQEIPELYEALQQGRMLDSMKVVDSLHKQALGYEVTETEEAEHMDRNGKIHILHKTINKHVQPSVTAAIYLLKTRHGDKWMDIVKTEKTQNLNIMVKNVNFSDVSMEEMMHLKALGIKNIPEEFRSTKMVQQKAGLQTQHVDIQDVHGN